MIEVFSSGVLRERWDNTARQYTAWNSAGVQTEQRAYTADENTRADAEALKQSAEANSDSLKSKARSAVTNNNTFLAIASPTNAQVVAQVKALTRQNNALIKLILGEFTDMTGT